MSSDAIRAELLGDEEDQTNNSLVFDEAHSRILGLLGMDIPVVFDATNVNRKFRKELLGKVSELSDLNVGVVYTGDYETCVMRNTIRERRVPHDVIKRQLDSLLSNQPCLTDGFDYLISMELMEECIQIGKEMGWNQE